MASRHFVGLDLGQSQDFTAIAIAERAELVGPWDPLVLARRKVIALRLRYLERLALGTPYTEVAERAAEVTRSPELAGRCELVVDATGVGRPVVDLLRKSRLGGNLIPVSITGGSAEGYGDGFHRVPKRELITGLQVLLQRGGLQIAAGMKYGEELVQELTEMRVKVNRSGYETFEPWSESTHDDLVLAVALACWRMQTCLPCDPTGAQAYWQYPYPMAFGERPPTADTCCPRPGERPGTVGERNVRLF